MAKLVPWQFRDNVSGPVKPNDSILCEIGIIRHFQVVAVVVVVLIVVFAVEIVVGVEVVAVLLVVVETVVVVVVDAFGVVDIL